MFCGYCGAQLEPPGVFCQKCGARQVATPAPGNQPVMGQPVMNQPVMGQPVINQPVMGQPVMGRPVMNQPVMNQPMGASQPSGAFIREVGKVNIFNGAGAIGVTYGAGYLSIFDDRLELQKTAGTSAGFGINPIAGMAMSVADKKRHPMDVWYFRDIAQVYSAKHAGAISKFVIKFKNGKALSYTLAGAKNAAPKVEELVQFMQQFL